MDLEKSQDVQKSPLIVKIFAVILALFALPLLIGGVDLAIAGGSWYYLISGVMLIASGVLLFKNKPKI